MWKITKDNICGTEESRVGHQEEHDRIPLMLAVAGFQSEPLPAEGLQLIPFRLKDDDGEVYYEGMLHDDDECLNQEAALSYGANDAGCTIIEVKRQGTWRVEIC